MANAAGDAIDCTAPPPAGNTDTLASLSCSNNEVAQWNGSAWVCASAANSDTLNTLTCSAGEVAEYNGTSWICAVASGSDNLGNHVAGQDLDMNSFKVDNVESVIYEGVSGGTPIGGKGGIQSGIDTVAVSGDPCTAIGALAVLRGVNCWSVRMRTPLPIKAVRALPPAPYRSAVPGSCTFV